jgi:signal recognition particle receptor subunit beta
MVFFNWATMQMAAKIVYYGPGLCGKTTNLSFIYAKTAPGSRGEMVSLETETDRTLFFDLLPIEVGNVGGFRTRLQLYTVPGQVFYNATRKLVLKGVDGIVFVADSQRPMADANLESFANLVENLKELGVELGSVPLVLQFNKRDLKNIVAVRDLEKALNPGKRWDTFEAVAVKGVGVFETLKAITKMTIKAVRKRMAAQEGAEAAPSPPAAGARVAFNPARLSAAASEGLDLAGQRLEARARVPGVRPEPVPTPQPRAVAAAANTETHDNAAQALQAAQLEPLEEAVEVEATPDADEITQAEEADEGQVEFATTSEPAPVVLETAVRHVKVSSSLDILASLDSLRKAATLQPGPARQQPASTSFDLDALLRSSLNSRQEVRRRVEETVGDALQHASQCRVRIELVDAEGRAVSQVEPIEVALKKGEPLRQLVLTLNVHLLGE